MAATSSIGKPPDDAPADARFTVRQRLLLFLITWTAYLAVWLIGPTLRWTVELEDGVPNADPAIPGIYVFWHRCVIPVMYRYRGWNLAVMTSRSFDGEYIARIIERFGFRAVRGSSTRGGMRALLGMHTLIEQGQTVVFTIDGPRGPRFVAKPGPVLLARNTGVPIGSFHVALERAWVFNSWDRFMLPKPFSRALIRIGSPIVVPADATSEQVAEYHAEMQAKLDSLRELSEAALLAATGRNA